MLSNCVVVEGDIQYC